MKSETNTTHSVDYDAVEAEQHKGIRVWVAEHLNGEVTDIRRLERWRPQWKVTYTANNETNAVLFRGNRSIAGKQDLKFEMEEEYLKIAEARIEAWKNSDR